MELADRLAVKVTAIASPGEKTRARWLQSGGDLSGEQTGERVSEPVVLIGLLALN